MADAQGDNILKVLSGNQFGAEVTLSDGTYSFGSGDDADIQLLDVSLQPLHGQVRLRDGKIEIRAMQGDFSTASGLSVARDDDTWHEIAQMDAVSAGLSKFVIAGSGANWSSLVPATPAQKPRKPADFGLAGRTFAALPRRVIYAAGGAVALLALVTMLGGNGGDAAQRGGAEATAAAMTDLRAALAAMPFASGVKIDERADGTLSIEGYVEDQVERRAIQNAFDASGLPGALRVFVRENLRADVAGTIDSMKVPATFTLDDAGNLTLRGTVLDPAAAARLTDSIRTGVFGLASVKSEMRTADEILSDLRGIARDAGLGNLVIFRLDGLVVEATGIVPRDKVDNWVGLIGAYSRRFAAEIPLRSFVTLDQPAASDTAPVIIGSGPAAAAETGRVVAPETLTAPNEIDARSLFAGPPTGQPVPSGAAAAPVRPAIPPNLAAALDQLARERPELYRSLSDTIAQGRMPDAALLQQIMSALGGQMQSTASGSDGVQRVEVVIPGIGAIGTLDELAAQMRDALARPAAPSATAQATAPLGAAPVAATPLAGAPILLAAPAAAQAPAQAPQPAADQPAAAQATAPQLAQTAAIAPQPEPTRPAATDPAPAQPAPTQTAVTQTVADAETPAQPAPAQADAADATPPVAPAIASTAPDAPPQPAASAAAATEAPALLPAAEPEGTSKQGLPFFSLPGGESAGLDRMMAEADAVMAPTGATAPAVKAAISPNLLALVSMQHEQLQMGRTLMRLPRPLSALPYPVDEPVTCWTGGKLTPEMLPAALLLLDSLSLSSESDITTIAPDLRDVIMETALSPARVRACLDRTRTDFGQMVGNSSTFLAETARNPDFVEFLFRNVPRSDLPVVGASLEGDRYIELRDGRKLREGAAPDITSRLTAIGDLGILVRTADGTRIQTFGPDLGWRVVDACATPDCKGK